MAQHASAQARLTLSDAFERFSSTVSLEDKREFTNTALKDVREEAMKIERQLRARRTQKHLARLEPFLRGMEHYSKVIEVLCNGTPYLPWIWAPVKLMLVITMDSLSAFEKLIEAYGKIGDMLPRFDRLASALKHDHNFQAVLALVYADILEFHRRTYKFVHRKSWVIFFSSMWAGFESRFSSILQSLTYHSDLVEKEASALNVSEAIVRSKKEAEFWKHQEHEWQGQKLRTVLSWLATDDIPPEDTLRKHTRNCLPDSCRWFIQHEKTSNWLDDTAVYPLLWLYGKPGAGKSVLCSNLVQHAIIKGVDIFFYFCSYLDNSNASSSHLLRALAAQIIQHHQDLALHVYEKYARSHPVPSKKVLLEVLPELLATLDSVRFVVDGMDEWNEYEQKEVIDDLSHMVSTDRSSYICKVLISSRETREMSRIIRRRSRTVALISLSDDGGGIAIDQSIESYVDRRLSELPDHLDELDPDASELDRIKRTLREKSNGMFLWVRLVMDMLDTVYSIDMLRNLVDTLPSDLEALYGRIYDRLCNSRGSQACGGVPRMLSWICFAQRPLHRNELLHGLAILPTDMYSPASSVPLAQILDHCKPFIEERSDATIVFVHFSVQEFLMKPTMPCAVSSMHAQFDISLACATTLIRSLDILCFHTSRSDHMIRVARGSFRLLPYALEHWIEHFLRYATQKGLVDFDQYLPCRLNHLHEKHDELLQRSDLANIVRTDFKSFENEMDERIKLVAHLPIHKLIQNVLYVRWSTERHDCENGKDAEDFAVQRDQTLFSKLSADFESIVVDLLSHEEIAGIPKPVLEAFQHSYASTAFRCRYQNCVKSLAGFASADLRNLHEAIHYRRVYCEVNSCQLGRIGFKNKKGLDVHMRKHRDGNSGYLIPPKVRQTIEVSPHQQSQSAPLTPTEEIQAAAHRSPLTQTLPSEQDYADDHHKKTNDKLNDPINDGGITIACLCGEGEYHADVTSVWIQCDTCKVWQHGGCVGIGSLSDAPDKYFCEQCRSDLHTIVSDAKGKKSSIYRPVHSQRKRGG